jgi:hypothetical protein
VHKLKGHPLKKAFRCMAIAGLLMTPGFGMSATTTKVFDTRSEQQIEHGGGCRKSSPPGQCCHMDNSVGRVHCH